MSSDIHPRRRATAAFAALLGSIALAAVACGPGPSPTSLYTAVPLQATPWSGGTTGQFGLHIDPSLLGRLPQTIDAYPLVENAGSESQAMDNADLSRTFDGYAAAAIGVIGDDNWLNVVIGRFKPAMRDPDVAEAWVSQYATGACSQANAVSSTRQETINGWIVDVATCGTAGPVVYTLVLGDGVILSMYGYGPRDLGRKLIEAIYS